MIRATSLILASVLALPAVAEPTFKADITFSAAQPDATSGISDHSAVTSGLRMMNDGWAGDVRFEYHLNLQHIQGSSLALIKASEAAAIPTTLFDLTASSDIGSDGRLSAVLDRASLAYTTDQTVLKIGRQAITWGMGTVFHPGDFVAPFSPSAVDTSFKSGVDLIYGQYLFDSGADIQAIYVPRPSSFGGSVDQDASTLALRGYASLGAVDVAWTVAQDRGDQVQSLGFSGALGGAAWKAEVVDWDLASGTVDPSWLVSLTNFGSIGDFGTTYFAELYHNGFGEPATVASADLSDALKKRMQTGQVFYAGENFLALGGSLLVSPDIGISPSAIVSLDDSSWLFGLSGNLTVGDNANISLSYFQPFGADGTEFGGRETSSGSGVFAGPSPTLTLTATQYF